MGCGRTPESVPAENNAALAASAQPETPSPQQSISQSIPGTEARNSADPNSAAEASAVLASYAGLVEEKRWADARRLWTEGSDTSAIEAQLRQFERLKLDVGEPGPAEGAAGSIYIEIPLRLTGVAKSGEPLSLAGTATLRRVNDVPGSSEVQRRWHIYGLDLQPRP
jgi:hypothetical protein